MVETLVSDPHQQVYATAMSIHVQMCSASSPALHNHMFSQMLVCVGRGNPKCSQSAAGHPRTLCPGVPSCGLCHLLITHPFTSSTLFHLTSKPAVAMPPLACVTDVAVKWSFFGLRDATGDVVMLCTP